MVPLRTSVFILVLAGLLSGCAGSQQTGTSAEREADASRQDPIVARFADTTLTRSDFEAKYAETVGNAEIASDSSVASYQKFLEQLVNYRLKVRAARDARLDTLTSVQQDIRSYRQKMARSQLMESEVYEPAVRELYERRKEVVDVSHVLISVESGQDTLQAYRTIQAIADSLERGIPFRELAIRNSDDPTARKEGSRGYGGRLGYIRAGQIVKPFEDRMYALEPGETSGVFRTRYGYHIIEVHDRRPVDPPIRLSHILVRSQGNTTNPRQLLDSLRTEIVQKGADFAGIAREYSEDRQSAAKGGDLGEVPPRNLPSSFQKAVADLDSVGAVSGVVESQFGYHLLKLTGRQERPSFAEAYKSLRKSISGQPRVERQKMSFAREVRTEEGVTVDTTRILDVIGLSSADSLARPLFSWNDTASGSGPPIATLGDSTYTLDQLARHLTQADGGAQLSVGQLIEDFLNEKAFQYAGARLEERDSSFASMMREYRNGVLLFRYMQDSVWTVAARDSAGLRHTFEQNRDRYRFPERVQTIALRAPSDSLLRPHRQMLENGNTVGEIVQIAGSDSLVSVDTTFVSGRSLEVYRPVLSVADGAAVGPVTYQNEAMLLIRDTLLPPRQKSFDEARSSVVQDHQDRYEQDVIRRLRERYEVETYPERLRSAFRESSTATSPTS